MTQLAQPTLAEKLHEQWLVKVDDALKAAGLSMRPVGCGHTRPPVTEADTKDCIDRDAGAFAVWSLALSDRRKYIVPLIDNVGDPYVTTAFTQGWNVAVAAIQSLL